MGYKESVLMRARWFAVVIALWTTSASAQKPSLFVWPQTRDGFSDMTEGIRDSIRDITSQIGGSEFTRALSPESATMVLTVLGRGVVARGTSGTFFEDFGLITPYNVPTVSSVLRVGQYQFIMQSEGASLAKSEISR